MIDCPKSASHSHDARRDGSCRWCEQRVTSPMPRPKRFDVSDLTVWYGRFYDPNWGGGKWDM